MTWAREQLGERGTEIIVLEGFRKLGPIFRVLVYLAEASDLLVGHWGGLGKTTWALYMMIELDRIE